MYELGFVCEGWEWSLWGIIIESVGNEDRVHGDWRFNMWVNIESATNEDCVYNLWGFFFMNVKGVDWVWWVEVASIRSENAISEGSGLSLKEYIWCLEGT